MQNPRPHPRKTDFKSAFYEDLQISKACKCFKSPDVNYLEGFPGGSVIKNPAANAGDLGLIPGPGGSPGGGNGNPLQYSGLENHRDRGAWRATVTKSRTQLSTHIHTYLFLKIIINLIGG